MMPDTTRKVTTRKGSIETGLTETATIVTAFSIRLCIMPVPAAKSTSVKNVLSHKLPSIPTVETISVTTLTVMIERDMTETGLTGIFAIGAENTSTTVEPI
ncbi:MAG: hypothetical protein IJ668_09685 [Selenomonadaceae bacterium]|nr:hypothetical protein [Selenomonadaceae bacterium]